MKLFLAALIISLVFESCGTDYPPEQTIQNFKIGDRVTIFDGYSEGFVIDTLPGQEMYSVRYMTPSGLKHDSFFPNELTKKDK